jgi:hypothetical protein
MSFWHLGESSKPCKTVRQISCNAREPRTPNPEPIYSSTTNTHRSVGGRPRRVKIWGMRSSAEEAGSLFSPRPIEIYAASRTKMALR